jgi:NhaP-type Na+/H+ or K+/H+ antiporter
LIPSSMDGWMIASTLFATDPVMVVMIAGLSRISKRLDNN